MSGALRRPRGGKVKDSYDSQAMISRFESIRDKLQSEARRQNKDYGPVRTADLAKLTADLQQFMEDNFGVTAKKQGREWLMTRFPAKLFRDYSPKGPLCAIIRTAYEHKEMMDWRSFNFESKGKRDENMHLFLSLQTRLLETGFLKWPHIYLDDSVPEDMHESLRNKAEAHSATMVDSEEEATHIVSYVPEVDDMDGDGEEDEEEDPCYLRVLEGPQKGQCRVHWWYHPDSYDESIPADEVDGPIAGSALPKDPGPPYRVSVRFILDVDRFNEWGNEFDYEVEPRCEDLKTVPKPSSRHVRKSSITSVSSVSSPTSVKSSSAAQSGALPSLSPKPAPAAAKAKHDTGTSGGGKTNSSSNSKANKQDPPPSPESSAASASSVSSAGPSKPQPVRKPKAPETASSSAPAGLKPSLSADTLSSITAPATTPTKPSSAKGKMEGPGLKPSTSTSSLASKGSKDGDHESVKSSRKRSEPDQTAEESPAGNPSKRSRTQGGDTEGSRRQSSKRLNDRDSTSSRRTKRESSGGSMAGSGPKLKASRKDSAVPEFNQVSEVKPGSESFDDVVPPSEDLARGEQGLMVTDIETGAVTTMAWKGEEEDTSGSEEEGPTAEEPDSVLSHLRPLEEDLPLASEVDEAPPRLERINVPRARRPRPLPHMASQFGPTWFREDLIHPIERRCLPEFFNGQSPFKTPEVYLAYRSHMMAESRSSPNEYLTCTDCRRRLAGDVGSIMRVHEFLDTWGLINSEVPDELRPPGSALRTVPNPSAAMAHAYDCDSKGGEGNDDDEADTEEEDEEDEWSEEDVQRLIAAAVELKDDWEGIAARVGGDHDSAECLLKFLSLPLEGVSGASVRKTTGSALREGSSPLPIEIAAQLAKAVHPDVVRAVMAAAWKEASAARERSTAAGTTATYAPAITDDAMPMDVTADGQPADGDAPPQEPKLDKSASALVDVLEETTRVGAAAVLSMIGIQARALAEAEEAEAKRLLDDILDLRLTRLETKSRQLQEMEKVLEAERAALQREREDMILKRSQEVISIRGGPV